MSEIARRLKRRSWLRKRRYDGRGHCTTHYKEQQRQNRKTLTNLHSRKSAESRARLGADQQPPRGLVEPVAVQWAVQRSVVALGGLEEVRQGLPHAAPSAGARVALFPSAPVHLYHTSNVVEMRQKLRKYALRLPHSRAHSREFF